MPVIQEALWKNPGNPGMIVVTSHGLLDGDGRLFMGYGAGQEAIRRIPEIELEAGREVIANAVDGVYGFLPIRPSIPEQKKVGFGLFQTRSGWDQVPDPELIQHSMTCLRRYTLDNADTRIRMNFPGIGPGGLAVDEVAPLLLPLPETVTICHSGEIEIRRPDSFIGFKEIYLRVERILQEGRQREAVEYLMANGFDIQSALEQAAAVQRILQERAESEAMRLREFRRSRTGNQGMYQRR